MEQELTTAYAIEWSTKAVDDSLLSFQGAEMGAEAASLTHGRHKHFTPTALVTKNPSEIKVRSDQLTLRILLGLLDGKKYKRCLEHRLATYTQNLPKGRGYVSLSFSPRDEESWDHVLASLDVLGDELVDTFLVLLAVALDTNGAEHITIPFTITPDDILAIRQKKKSKGSYSARQRQNVLEHLYTLARASVSATLTLPQGKQRYIEGPLLEILTDCPSEETEIRVGFARWPVYRLKIGNWVTMVSEHQYQIAVLARQVLRYHAKEQRHEKRLGRYLTMLYRINAHKHEDWVKVSMGVLLEQAGIAPDLNHPGRTQEAIESALKQLHTDGVIGPFVPLVEDSSRGREIQERIRQHAYHWWDDYRQQLWRFDLPDHLREAYQGGLLRKTGVPD
jgi:hypothetical protein